MRTLQILSLLLLPVAFAQAAPKEVDPAYLASIQDDNLHPLPRGFSAWEIANYRAPELPDVIRVPPMNRVRAQAEYEGNEGLIVRWGSFNSLLTEMTTKITTAQRGGRVMIVVTGASQQSSATAILQGASADLSRVTFVTQACNPASACSVWMRDYGPRFIDDGGRLGIVDHVYNRPARTLDDTFPTVFASVRGEQRYDLPLVHGGGNFHLFRNRDAYMTRLIADENPSLSEQAIKDLYLDYQGLDLTLTDPFPATYDSTQHIDMWMLPLADDSVLIGEYAASEGGGIPKTVSDATANLMTSRGYTVYRTPGWRANGAHYTYTNSVLLNGVALICKFGGAYAARDAQALATFRSALPESEVMQVDCSGIIASAGAIHCIVMHIPDLLFRQDFDASP